MEALKYKGTLHCARTIIREEGVLALWNGAGPAHRSKWNNPCVSSRQGAVRLILVG